MNLYKRLLIAANLLLITVFIGYSIRDKEHIISDGTLVLLPLAPYDPRSLMQGDYMNLRYDIDEGLLTDSLAKNGYCVIARDAKGVGRIKRLQAGAEPLDKSEQLIKYTFADRNRINIGAESYFFQEGKARNFVDATYGALRIDQAGNSVLVGLYNEKLEALK